MMRSGLSLLELVIALAIASMLSLLLYQSLDQTNRVVRSIEASVGGHTEIALFGDRLTRDINGIFVPLAARREPEKEAQEKEAKQEEQKQKNESAKAESEKEREKPLRDILVIQEVTLSEKSEPLATFITSNPLVVYGQSPVRRVRVSYALQPQKGSTKLWQLVRYEATELDPEKFTQGISRKTISGYEILRNIRNVRITCIVAEQEKDDEDKEKAPDQEKKEKEKKGKKKKVKKFEEFNTWNDEARLKEEKRLLPDFVKVTGTVLDARQKREIDLAFFIAIPVKAAAPAKQKKKPELPDALKKSAANE